MAGCFSESGLTQSEEGGTSDEEMVVITGCGYGIGFSGAS